MSDTTGQLVRTDIGHDRGTGLTVVLPERLRDEVSYLIGSSKSANTRRAYAADWARFTAWCERHSLTALPAAPVTVCAYLADHAGQLSVATLQRHLATISKAHQLAGHETPTRTTQVRDTFAGLRREHGKPADEAAGLLREGMRDTLAVCGGDLAGLRDRALLLVGWCGALRRSELAALTWGDIAAHDLGAVVTLRRSKTDQTRQGRRVPLRREQLPAVCPVSALTAWRTALWSAGFETPADGPVFRQVTRHGAVGGQLSGSAVASIIQRRTQQANLPDHYRGHSLRKGMVQQAHLAGRQDSAVMATTGHQSVTMLRRYQSQAGLVERCASAGLLT